MNKYQYRKTLIGSKVVALHEMKTVSGEVVIKGAIGTVRDKFAGFGILFPDCYISRVQPEDVDQIAEDYDRIDPELQFHLTRAAIHLNVLIGSVAKGGKYEDGFAYADLTDKVRDFLDGIVTDSGISSRVHPIEYGPEELELQEKLIEAGRAPGGRK